MLLQLLDRVMGRSRPDKRSGSVARGLRATERQDDATPRWRLRSTVRLSRFAPECDTSRREIHSRHGV